MADLNKLFPGFESFMDGDIEINNEVTVPESEQNLLLMKLNQKKSQPKVLKSKVKLLRMKLLLKLPT